MSTLMSKPSKPEELYKFFAYGMSLDYTKSQPYFSNCLRKRGWNVFITTDIDSVWLQVAYYANWNRSETWRLEVYKYVKYDKQN